MEKKTKQPQPKGVFIKWKTVQTTAMPLSVNTECT